MRGKEAAFTSQSGGQVVWKCVKSCPVSDIRYLGGLREKLGMPSFGDVLTAEDARAIQAYVLFRAAESAAALSN